MRADRGRAFVWLLAAAAALGLAAGWAAVAPLPQGPRELLYVIPKGTAARQAAGDARTVLPSRIHLTIGVQDVLIIRNEDDAEQKIGPALLAPGQTYRLPFRSPAEIPLVCSAHPDGQLTIAVQAAPATGGSRLRWRLSRLAEAASFP